MINAQGDRESDYQILSYTGEEFKVIGSYISVDNKITIQSSGWEFPGNRSLSDPPATCGEDGYICLDAERESRGRS